MISFGHHTTYIDFCVALEIDFNRRNNIFQSERIKVCDSRMTTDLSESEAYIVKRILSVRVSSLTISNALLQKHSQPPYGKIGYEYR